MGACRTHDRNQGTRRIRYSSDLSTPLDIYTCLEHDSCRARDCILASTVVSGKGGQSIQVRNDIREVLHMSRVHILVERRTVCTLVLANPGDTYTRRASRSTPGRPDNRPRKSAPSRTYLSIPGRRNTRSSRYSCRADILAESYTCRRARHRSPICSDIRRVDGRNPEEGRSPSDRLARRTNRRSILASILLRRPRRRRSASSGAEKLVSRRLVFSISGRTWVQRLIQKEAHRVREQLSRRRKGHCSACPVHRDQLGG